jgi:hypothetical protein
MDDDFTAPAFRRSSATVIVVALVVLVAVPLVANSARVDQTTVRNQHVEAVAEAWAEAAGWSVVAVTSRGRTVLIQATGPRPTPSPAQLRHQLSAAGFNGLPVKLDLVPAVYSDLPP